MTDGEFGLSGSELDLILSTLARFPAIARAKVFGSRAKGEFRPGSDIDIALFGSDIDHNMVNAISLALDDMLIAHRADLVVYNEIENPALREHIDRVGKDLYRAD